LHQKAGTFKGKQDEKHLPTSVHDTENMSVLSAGVISVHTTRKTLSPMGLVLVNREWCILILQMEGSPPLRKVATNILNKQSRTADKGLSTSLGVGVGLRDPHSKNFLFLRNVSKRLGPGLILWHDLSNGKRT